MKQLALAIAAALTPVAASAHPDHAREALELTHFASDPFHIATLIIAVAAATVVAVALRTHRARR